MTIASIADKISDLKGRPMSPERFRAKYPPTQRQLKILSMLDQWIKIHAGMSPTYRELAQWCRVTSTRTITEHVHALIRKGYVDHIANERRTICITAAGEKILKVSSIPVTPITYKL